MRLISTIQTVGEGESGMILDEVRDGVYRPGAFDPDYLSKGVVGPTKVYGNTGIYRPGAFSKSSTTLKTIAVVAAVGIAYFIFRKRR